MCHPDSVGNQTVWAFPVDAQLASDPVTRRALGPLATLASDSQVTDVFVLPDGQVFADRGEGAVLVSGLTIAAEDAVELSRSLIEAGGRHLDEASPVVDVRLGPGIRVHAALPPVSVGGATLSIRFSRRAFLGIDDLDIQWQHDQQQRIFEAVRNRETLLVSGSTGSGKTTLLASLLALSSPRDRIVVLEDVTELAISHPHVVQLECRQANLEGAGEVTLDRLVRESLRMRPSRLVVGECRGAELRDLLAALTTGHSGGAATVHAHSLSELPARLEALAVMAGLSPEQLARQATAAFDLVVHVERVAGQRRALTLGKLTLGEDHRLVAVEL